jgi:hypothetical protein
MIGLRIGRKASPTPRNPPSVLKPRSPRPGLIFVRRDSFGNRPAPERGAIAGAYIGAMIEPPAKSGAGLFGSHNSKPRFGGFVSAGVRAGEYQVCKAKLQPSEYSACAIKVRRGIVALF